jgi:hypothetical protein
MTSIANPIVSLHSSYLERYTSHKIRPNPSCRVSPWFTSNNHWVPASSTCCSSSDGNPGPIYVWAIVSFLKLEFGQLVATLWWWCAGLCGTSITFPDILIHLVGDDLDDGVEEGVESNQLVVAPVEW